MHIPQGHWRNLDDGPMPTRKPPFGPRLPDLHQIDEAVWPAVLAELPEADRFEACLHPHLHERALRAQELAESLPPSVTDRARAAIREAPHVPVPRVERRRPLRQVNIRVQQSEYADLEVAARLLGAKPAQLARMLVLNGVRRALADQDSGR